LGRNNEEGAGRRIEGDKEEEKENELPLYILAKLPPELNG